MGLILSNLTFSHFLAPSMVEFRAKTGWGEQVIRVSFTTREPRIKAWVEKLGEPDEPMYLAMSEIERAIQEARILLAV